MTDRQALLSLARQLLHALRSGRIDEAAFPLELSDWADQNAYRHKLSRHALPDGLLLRRRMATPPGWKR